MAQKSSSKTQAKPPARSGKARGGRPTRAEALRRRIEAVGVDPALVDPRRVLAGIAIDESASAAARVAACRVLIATGAGAPNIPAAVLDETIDDDVPDELSRRALEILAARGRPN